MKTFFTNILSVTLVMRNLFWAPDSNATNVKIWISVKNAMIKDFRKSMPNL